MHDHIVLTDTQRRRLLEVFGCFVPMVERVDVYGSRARGSARPGSDIDLIVAGPVNEATLLRIRSALSDSYLSIFADVAAYGLLRDDGFSRAVSRDARTLFDAADLAAAPLFNPVDGLREWYRPVGPPATPSAERPASA